MRPSVAMALGLGVGALAYPLGLAVGALLFRRNQRGYAFGA